MSLSVLTTFKSLLALILFRVRHRLRSQALLLPSIQQRNLHDREDLHFQHAIAAQTLISLFRVTLSVILFLVETAYTHISTSPLSGVLLNRRAAFRSKYHRDLNSFVMQVLSFSLVHTRKFSHGDVY
jgi:hypothetical protein